MIDPIATKYDVTPQQIALAWQLHRTATALPIPGTTSAEHLHQNLAAASISLTSAEVDAITGLAPKCVHRWLDLHASRKDGMNRGLLRSARETRANQ